MSESQDNESLIQNNIEVYIKPKKTQSDNSLNLRTKADTVIHKKRYYKLSNTGYNNSNKINSSMLLLKELAFEPQKKELPSLNKTTPNQIITMDYKAKLYEEMINIWIEKDIEIIFKLQGVWGLEELGLCACDGYPNKMLNGFPLCSLLGRIGSQSNFFQIKNNMRYSSAISGPLFLLMNISSDIVINNQYSLSGSINIEIYNAKKYTDMQILKLLTFEEELLSLFGNDFYSNHNHYTNSELSFVLFLNQIRTRPDLCLKYFFPANADIAAIIQDKGKRCQIVKLDDTLKKIAEEAKEDVPFDERVNNYNVKHSYAVLKEYQCITISKHYCCLLLQTMNMEDSFIFNSTFEYIGLSVKTLPLNEGKMIKYICVFVLAGNSKS